MIPLSFAALTVPNLNDLVNTFAQETTPPVYQFAERYYQTLGATPFDVRGDQRSKLKFPITWQFSYVFMNPDPELVADHINTVCFTDVGNTGQLNVLHKPLSAGSAKYLYCTAELVQPIIRRPHGEMEQTQATLALVVKLANEFTEHTP